jgi:hypothetical protein
VLVSAYAVALMLLTNLAGAKLAAVPLQFILKDTLKLGPQQQATFTFLSDIPYFVGFALGFLRDRWRPFGRGDQAYFLVLPVLLAGANMLIATGPFSYSRLLLGTILTAALFVLLGAASRALLATLAQNFGMTGRVSVVLMVAPRVVEMLSNVAGGHLSRPAQQHTAYLLSAALCLPMVLMGVWRPRAIFRGSDATGVRAIPEGTLQALKRLARHRAIYLPAAILFLWDFAPGWSTPLFFYLTNHVKLSEADYGYTQALMGAGTLAATLAYSALCLRMRLRPLLYTGTLLGVLGCPIFLLIRNAAEANVISFLAGASLGIGLCAYSDLLIRCCPPELEGAAMLFTGAMSAIAGDSSDIVGAWLYEKGGFGLALGATTVITACIFLVLAMIPRRLTEPPEGEKLRGSLVAEALEEAREV